MEHERKDSSDKHREDLYDEAVEESFPASDAPAACGATRIESPDEADTPPKKPKGNASGEGKKPTRRHDGGA